MKQEEPKQEHNKYLSCCRSEEECHCGKNRKKETLEEAAEKYADSISKKWIKLKLLQSEIEDIEVHFIAGVKFQQEQDKNKYNEEEVETIIQQLKLKLKSGVLKWQEDFEFDLKEWFEQFKKK